MKERRGNFSPRRGRPEASCVRLGLHLYIKAQTQGTRPPQSAGADSARGSRARPRGRDPGRTRGGPGAAARHSRPLLEVVPRGQPFVDHGPDHPVLPAPLPVQHPPSLEQLLLQLLRGRKTLLRRRPRPAPGPPAPGAAGPSRGQRARDAAETRSAPPNSHRSRPVDLAAGSTHG